MVRQAADPDFGGSPGVRKSRYLHETWASEESSKIKVRDFWHTRKSVPHRKVSGKGGKTRYVLLHPDTNARIHEFLDAAGRGEGDAGAQQHDRPARQAITPDGIYKLVRAYSAALGLEIGVRALRATAATNALGHQLTLPRCRNGLGTPTSQPRASTIIAAHGRKIARPLR
jgi:integrase/recombinase XerD